MQNKLTAHELADKLNKKEISAKELAESVYSQIDKTDKAVKAYLLLTKDLAIACANKIDEKRAKGEALHPLAGIPIGIKDNMCLKGVKTTCASRILENYVPPYTATVVEQVILNGMIPIGKLNMDEFAMGSSTENSAFQKTRNPWNLDCVPGGSSGGSAAAVAADECIVALGSDTGGSIRQPASFCGVVGLKPTYGRVSRYGLVAFASSLDQIGPLAKDVKDAAMLLDLISAHDPKDSTSVNRPSTNCVKALTGKLDNIKTIGVVKELMGEGIDTEVKKAVQGAIKVYEKLGAKIIEVSMPTFKHALPVYYIVATAEASANLARYDGVKFGYRSKNSPDLLTMYYNTRQEGFGPEVKRRIMLGTYTLSAGYYDAYYLKALKVRTLIRRDYEKAFKECDILISPTSPTVSFKFGEKTDDPLSMYLSDIATIPINLAGIPAISIPCGFSKGLPVGLQLMGKAFDEENLLKAAFAYEQQTDWHLKKAEVK